MLAALQGIRQLKRLSLSDILFRDGTIYFVVLFILNILHLVLSVTTLAEIANTGTSYVTIFTGPLTAILILHFLLNLQEAGQAVVRLDPDDPLHSSRDPYDTPSFITSLGAFINPDLLPPSDDDLEWDIGPLDLDRQEKNEEEDRVQATESGPQTVAPSRSM
ncbi:hypothetical protein K466DRAFT_600979 [Polyporus arcularius HHB13444]|uniref:Uncharacterized protein n=1 Tax=Polyporus arcularius HHB13444 TaxID=1314778 RepID=A0A5C3PAM1_9APHY|nr:hypothetical protein K466DRAFT_600979 [Polyporus arcularius HHB13444]